MPSSDTSAKASILCSSLSAWPSVGWQELRLILTAGSKGLSTGHSGNEDEASKAKGGLAQGLSTALLLFCIGTFSIVGPMNSALYGDNTFLYTNATLDLITSMVFATTYGIGIAFAAPVLFCWQGMFYLIAKLAGGIIPDALIHEIIAVGGLLIVASGLSLLELKDCKSLNLLPSLLVPVLFFLVLMF
jgi:Uncharacterized membrane protein, possible Na+ channel or pump